MKLFSSGVVSLPTRTRLWWGQMGRKDTKHLVLITSDSRLDRYVLSFRKSFAIHGVSCRGKTSNPLEIFSMRFRSNLFFAFSSCLLFPVFVFADVIVVGDGSSVATNSETIDLTAEGTIDWLVFASDQGLTGTPSDQKMTASGGSIGSLSYSPSVTNEILNFDNANNNYSWTDGTNVAAGNQNDNFDRILFDAGDSFSFTTNVDAAGDYQLKIYTAVFANNASLTSTLTNAGTSDTEALVGTTGLSNNYWTIDFTTTGADTLTTTVSHAGGTGSVFAFEAASLSGTPVAVPEPASAGLLALGLGVLAYVRRR